MSPSDARKRANAKWDKANMTVLGCKVKKTEAEAFKAHCEAQGKTSNTVLKDYVLKCIGCGPMEQDTSPQPTGAPTKAANPLASIITPDALRAAQKAAQATGEDMPTFMTRAVDRAVRTDKVAWSISVNPATGKEEKKGGKQT